MNCPTVLAERVYARASREASADQPASRISSPRSQRSPSNDALRNAVDDSSSRRFISKTIAAISALVLFTTAIGAHAQTRKVALKFQAMVGNEPFVCGRSYAGIGTSNSTLTPSDFAFYVHDIKLITSDGAEVPVTLDQDGTYQNGSLALLDFEDGTAACSNGNAQMHTSVVGTAPAAKYTGVQFTVGVPFDRNHLDLATQPSPLSLTRMFWAWNTGHKFVRFEAKSTEGKNWVMHLGSGGCVPTGSAVKAPTECAQANRPVITLTQFDIDAEVVVADIKSLFAGNGGAESQVCMSSLRSATCGPMFAALGLPFNAPATMPQTFLRKAAAPPSLRGADK